MQSARPERAPGMFGAAFDDLDVGAAFEAPARPISRGDVDVFAALTGDRHPLHTDAEWAAAGPFGEPIAHGLLILSCAVGELPLDPELVVALRRIRDVVFKRPLPVGGEIASRCRVTALRPLDEETGLVGCELRIAGGDERLIAKATLEILWRRRAAVADECAPVAAGADGPRVLL